MFNCCMPNYNIFMGGCCGNNIINTMFKMQIFKATLNNIFHPYQQQQAVLQPVMPMPQMPVMPMVPVMTAMPQMYSPSIFSNTQYPQMSYYNNDSNQDTSLVDVFRKAYNAIFKKKDKEEVDDSSDKSNEVTKDEESEKSDKSNKSGKSNKSNNTKKSDKSDKTGKTEESKSTKKTKKSGKKITVNRSQITDIVHQKAQIYGVDERLILAMINQESGFKNGRTSKKGARGLMQLMPATAKELGVTDINDPEQNIDAGIRYMKKLLDMYNGDVKKALAAYNAGMGNVNDILNGTNKCGKNPNYIKDSAGIPRIKETQNYVKNIYYNYKNYDVA